MTQHSERPSPADQPDGPVPHPATTDESAAETGQPADRRITASLANRGR